jgi:hypothetical protein
MRILWLRITTLAISTIWLVAAWEATQLEGGVTRSPLILLAFTFALSVGAALWLLVLGPRSWWDRLTKKATDFGTFWSQTTTSEWRRGGIALAAVSVLVYLILVGRLVPLQIDYEVNDQSAYLRLASEIHDSGIFGLLRRLYGGEFTEANRHPLFPAVLSFFNRADAGKWLSVGIGLVTLLLSQIMVARRFGWIVGGLFGVMLASNMAFCRTSTLITCEGLLILCSAAAWLLFLTLRDTPRFEEDEHAGHDDPVPRTAHKTVLASAALGLSFLTKGSGFLLLAGVLVWLCYQRVRRRIGTKQLATHVLLAACTFSLVASPLLVRNLRRFGTPLYNVNSHLLFLDKFELPEAIATQRSVAESARRYFATHTLRDMAQREIRGLVWEFFIVCRMLGPAPLDDSRVLFGVLLFSFGVLGARGQSRSQSSLPTIWFCIFMLFFAWYLPIVAGERFMLPLLVPLLVFAAEGVVRSLQIWCGGRWKSVLVLSSAAWCIGWIVVTYAFPYQ